MCRDASDIAHFKPFTISICQNTHEDAITGVSGGRRVMLWNESEMDEKIKTKSGTHTLKGSQPITVMNQ